MLAKTNLLYRPQRDHISLCLTRMISIMSSQIVRLISFISFNISFIEGNSKGRRNDLPETLTMAHFHPLSLMCCVANKAK